MLTIFAPIPADCRLAVQNLAKHTWCAICEVYKIYTAMRISHTLTGLGLDFDDTLCRFICFIFDSNFSFLLAWTSFCCLNVVLHGELVITSACPTRRFFLGSRIVRDLLGVTIISWKLDDVGRSIADIGRPTAQMSDVTLGRVAELAAITTIVTGIAICSRSN